MLQINKDLKLPEEVKAQLEELFKDAKVVIEPQENFIPKARFDEVNAKAKDAEKFADYDDIKTELDTLKADIDKYADYDDIKAKAAKVEEYADYDEIKSKYGETLNANKKLKLKTLGVDDAFLDYSLTQIGDGEFDAEAEAFIKANPKFRAESFQKIDSSFNLHGGQVKKLEDMTTEEYTVYRETHNVDGTEKNK